tara:strand:+ start:82 stop:435 length:354 start_codon:yes stop_codon:yes gene_type:complete
MNTQDRVNKLMFEKTELATHKVELGLLQDLNKADSEIRKLNEKAAGTSGAVSRALEISETAYINLLNEAENAIEIADKYIAAAKDLGLDAPKAKTVKKYAIDVIIMAKEDLKRIRKF